MRRRQSGQILLFALLVVVLMMIAFSLVAAVLAERQRALAREARAIELTTLADAALALTLAELAADPGFGGVRTRTFGKGELSSQVKRLSELEVEVLAHATYRGHPRQARARVLLAPIGPKVTRWQVVK